MSDSALQARIKRNLAHIARKRVKRAQIKRKAELRAKEKPPKHDKLYEEWIRWCEGI